MDCPKCKRKALCVDSRPQPDGSRWRKYRYPNCDGGIYTMERAKKQKHQAGHMVAGA